MSPQTVLAYPGDKVKMNPFAIGVPPHHYQWRMNGAAIAGATTSSYTVSVLSIANAGNYDVVVTNLYGSAVSAVSAVNTGITLTEGTGFVVDSNTANPERDGKDNGATWLASSSDGTVNRTGVMQFVAANTNGIVVPGSTNFDSATGTFSFWMRSPGTDTSTTGSVGAALFGRPGNSLVNDLILAQEDGAGNIIFNAPGTANTITSGQGISDNDWHLITLTYDQSASGGASLYIDGVLDTTNANTAAWTAPVGQELEIGFTSGQTLRAYNGLLDDVRVYNRQLTAAEITSLHNTGAIIDASALQMQLNFTTAPVAGLTLTWPTPNSVLQSATVASGPYSDVTAAISPYPLPVPKATGQKYYRYRFAPVAPTSHISNPYLM